MAQGDFDFAAEWKKVKAEYKGDEDVGKLFSFFNKPHLSKALSAQRAALESLEAKAIAKAKKSLGKERGKYDKAFKKAKGEVQGFKRAYTTLMQKVDARVELIEKRVAALTTWSEMQEQASAVPVSASVSLEKLQDIGLLRKVRTVEHTSQGLDTEVSEDIGLAIAMDNVIDAANQLRKAATSVRSYDIVGPVRTSGWTKAANTYLANPLGLLSQKLEVLERELEQWNEACDTLQNNLDRNVGHLQAKEATRRRKYNAALKTLGERVLKSVRAEKDRQSKLSARFTKTIQSLG